jgi:hypothetical protein
MGGLYGSEYWTYLLPRCVGAQTTVELTSAPFEPSEHVAVDIALLDHAFGESAEQFRAGGRRYAEDLASNPGSPLGWPTSVAHALATNNADRSPRTAPTSSRDCMSASSARTAATTGRRRFVYKLASPCAVTRRDRADRSTQV